MSRFIDELDFILWTRANGMLMARLNPDDSVVGVITTVVGQGQIIRSLDDTSVNDRWSYWTVAAALTHYLAWIDSDRDEPNGWIRHQPSNRRREDGDPTREEVRP